MWWGKKKKEEETISCATCKHLVLKKNAQEVVASNRDGWDYGFTSDYYCPEHKKPYSRKTIGWGVTKYYKLIPQHQVEVKEDGEEIKHI